MIVASRGEHIARALGLSGLRINVFPIMVGPPLGLNTFLTPPLPLPSAVAVEILPAMCFASPGGPRDPDEVRAGRRGGDRRQAERARPACRSGPSPCAAVLSRPGGSSSDRVERHVPGEPGAALARRAQLHAAAQALGALAQVLQPEARPRRRRRCRRPSSATTRRSSSPAAIVMTTWLASACFPTLVSASRRTASTSSDSGPSPPCRPGR